MKIQTLKSELENLRMKPAESMDDFAVKLNTIVNRIRSLGEKVEESNVVRKFLQAAPAKFFVVSTVEHFADFKTMTVEEVIGLLKAHGEQLNRFGEGGEKHVVGVESLNSSLGENPHIV